MLTQQKNCIVNSLKYATTGIQEFGIRVTHSSTHLQYNFDETLSFCIKKKG